MPSTSSGYSGFLILMGTAMMNCWSSLTSYLVAPSGITISRSTFVEIAAHPDAKTTKKTARILDLLLLRADKIHFLFSFFTFIATCAHFLNPGTAFGLRPDRTHLRINRIVLFGYTCDHPS